MSICTVDIIAEIIAHHLIHRNIIMIFILDTPTFGFHFCTGMLFKICHITSVTFLPQHIMSIKPCFTRKYDIAIIHLLNFTEVI